MVELDRIDWIKVYLTVYLFLLCYGMVSITVVNTSCVTVLLQADENPLFYLSKSNCRSPNPPSSLYPILISLHYIIQWLKIKFERYTYYNIIQ